MRTNRQRKKIAYYRNHMTTDMFACLSLSTASVCIYSQCVCVYVALGVDGRAFGLVLENWRRWSAGRQRLIVRFRSDIHIHSHTLKKNPKAFTNRTRVRSPGKGTHINLLFTYLHVAENRRKSPQTYDVCVVNNREFRNSKKNTHICKRRANKTLTHTIQTQAQTQMRMNRFHVTEGRVFFCIVSEGALCSSLSPQVCMYCVFVAGSTAV